MISRFCILDARTGAVIAGGMAGQVFASTEELVGKMRAAFESVGASMAQMSASMSELAASFENIPSPRALLRAGHRAASREAIGRHVTQARRCAPVRPHVAHLAGFAVLPRRRWGRRRA